MIFLYIQNYTVIFMCIINSLLFVCWESYVTFLYYCRLVNNVELRADHRMMISLDAFAGAIRAAELVPEEDALQHGHAGEGDGDQEEHREDEQLMG